MQTDRDGPTERGFERAPQVARSVAQRVGVVVIGRNEGERVRRSLTSVQALDLPVVYVDSASTDGSLEWATERGIESVALQGERLSAAISRNAGLQRLLELHPQLEWVQFLDGDSELERGWIDQAAERLERAPRTAIVCGRLNELDFETSAYRRLCQVEWTWPDGENVSCGGIFLGRVSALREVGGFNEALRVGEDPELCARLWSAGWSIERLPVAMAVHDSAMVRFGQWWTRQVRAAYGSLDVAQATRLRTQGLQAASCLLWTVVWSLGVLAGAACWLAPLPMPAKVLAVSFFPALWVLQALRIARKTRSHGNDWITSLLFGAFALIAKWAHLQGLVLYVHDRARRRGSREIDYKDAALQEVGDADGRRGRC